MAWHSVELTLEVDNWYMGWVDIPMGGQVEEWSALVGYVHLYPFSVVLPIKSEKGQS